MAEPLRILGIGDAKSRHFVRWAQRLAEQGHEMHIASGRYNPRAGEHDGLVVHQFQELDPLYRIPFLRRYRMIPALQKIAREVFVKYVVELALHDAILENDPSPN